MFLRPVRTRQPQGPSRIDWGNPITRGLVSAVIPATFVDSVSGKKLTFTGSAPAFLPREYGFRLTANGTMNLLADIAFKATEWTTFAIVDGVNSSTDRYYVGTGSSAAAPLMGIISGNLDGSKLRIWARSDGGQNTAASISGSKTLTDGKPHAVAVTCTQTTITGYADGLLEGSTAQPAGTYTGTKFSVGANWRSGALATGTNNNIGLALLFNRALSAAEIKSISENPWQIFAPDAKSLWVPDTVSAGGAATVIPIGVQATGSVGTPSATGAARATPSGVSASSAVGTPVAVGGASIPATALPAGVQATGAVGTVSATGAAVAQPAGVTASGAVGTPVAIGEAAGVTVVYPAGVQAVSAVGTPGVIAAARVLPIGVQAVGEVGGPLAYAGDEPPVVASSNYGFEMSAGKRYYIKRKGKILLFNSAEQADDYLATEQQATVVKSRGAKKRLAAKLVKVAPIETIELEPVTELLSRYMPEVSLPNLLKMHDIEQVLKMQQQALLMQDDEDIELLLMTL